MDDVAQLLNFFDVARSLTHRLATTRLVTVAAVQGLAAAGGLELASSCDIIFASDSATFADRHARYGFVPSFGATAYLPLKLGHARAAWLMLADGLLTAQEAREAGLVAYVASADDFETQLSGLIDRIATLDGAALAAMKSLLVDHLDLADALAREGAAVAEHARDGRYSGRPSDF